MTFCWIGTKECGSVDWSFPFWSSVLGVIGIVLAIVIARWTIRASTRSAQEATQKTLDAQRQSDLAAMLSELTGLTRHEGSRSKRLKRSPETAARWDSVIARLWFSGVDGASSVYPCASGGPRGGEATALRVRDIDLPRRRVVVNENAVRVNGRIIVGTPKSHHARSVSIPLFLQQEIVEAYAGKPVDALVFGDGTTHLNQPTLKGGWFVQAIARARRADPTFPQPTSTTSGTPPRASP